MKNFLLSIAAVTVMSICVGSASAQYQAIGTFNSFGRPNYLLNTPDVVSVSSRNDIAATLPESRSIPIYNPRLIAAGRPETIALTAASDVWISFIDEGAGYQNILGYYTFPTNAALVTAPTPSQVRVIFPNASKTGFGGQLNIGDKVYLGNFPANTSIGFVLLAHGWDETNSIITEGKWRIYSDSRFNPEADANLRRHTVMLNDTTSNRLLIGVEDIRRDGYNSDEDFNDLLFFATISNPTAIKNLDSIPILTKDGSISFSGNTGGLESKSLGDAVAKRMFHHAVTSTQGPLDYDKFPKLQQTSIRNAANGLGSNSSLSLSDIMPTKMIDSGYTAYVSTAADITSITNAVEVRSVDFTINKECRAVAFATKTIAVMYDHTKPVCDRLKGAELMGMENFQINNLNFVRYTLKQPKGNIEYAISFTVGKKKGRDSFSFQSQWLNQNYQAEDTLYNYQVWGAAPYYCIDMTLEILSRLKSIMPINTLKATEALPNTYIVSGKREGANLQLTLKNNNGAVNGYVQIEEKANENSSITTKRNVPVTLSANGKSALTIPVSDAYEATISLYLNNQLQDVVFMADGSWNVDYNKASTVVKQFNVSNDASATSSNATDLPLFRNVQLNATTSEYVSVYKLLKGGGAELDLTGYKTLNFKAAATGVNLRITLVKNSISNWKEQYTYYLPMSEAGKEYSIKLDDFKSSANQSMFNPNDLTTALFAFEVSTGKSTNISVDLSKVVFSKDQSVIAAATIETKDVQLYPNPSKGRFNASFKAEKAMSVTIKMFDATTGRPMYNKQVQIVKGDNTFPIEINQSINTNAYILSIEGEGVKYLPKKMLVQQ
jgi:hypothetical protein